MKKALISLLMVLAAAWTIARSAQTPQEKYIEKYSAIAVNEMYRSGVPASITLAQGLLESGYGLSRLAVEGNNHFGIKCHNSWKGRSMRADDDKRNECFRVYDTAEESFRDHSDFLRYRDRYKFLFDYETTDYKSWAYGLKQAGYATDPTYASKLIKLVEDYDLGRFDKMTVSEAEAGDPAVETPATVVPAVVPESPLKIEEASLSDASVAELYRFPMSRRLYSKNGVPFIVSLDGESYASIAKANHLFLKEILRYNDLVADEMLYPGTTVYLEPKKNEAPKGLEKYIVGSDEETLRGICQRFAVKEKSVRKMNGLNDLYVPREGDELKLRKR